MSRVIATLPRPITSPFELSPKIIFSFECVIGEYDENILLSLVIWFIHPLWSTQLDPPEEYVYKTSLVARFRSPIWLGALHVSHKNLRNPNRSIPIYVGFLSNIFCNHFPTAVVPQNKAWCQALSRCISLRLIGILILGGPHWFLRLLINRFLPAHLFLKNMFLLVHFLLGLNLIRNRIGNLPIFTGRGTAALHRGTAARGRCAVESSSLVLVNWWNPKC